MKTGIMMNRYRKTGTRIATITLTFMLLLATAGLFSACEKSEPAASGEETITVTDCEDRSVTLPKECSRIAVLDSFTGEAMVMAGAGSQMCACPRGVSSDIILREIYPQLDEVTAAGSSGAVNIETLTEAGAEVAFIKESMYEGGSETDKFDKLGIPYVVIGYETMDDQIEMLKLIGTVCGGDTEKKMRRITEYYEQTIQIVREHAAKIPDEAKVRVYHSINEIARTDGMESIGTDWVQAVGAVNVSAQLDTKVEGSDYQASLEQIYAWDPDVVICNAAETTDYMYADSKWAGLRAVREKQVKTIPVGATRWGQRGSVETYFAMLWLGSEIYPDVYSDIDLKEEVTNFYSEVLGVEVTDKLYEQIISGRGVRKAGDNTGAGKQE